MLFDYATLKVIWWVIITVLFVGFSVMGGIDLGVGILLNFVGQKDIERRLLINSIGPTWDGNQVWFLLAGGAMFAAWPFVYAAAFSGFYIALYLVLIPLILRPPGIDYRSKLESKIWRSTWDMSLFISGFVPSLLFGVAVGNLFLGIEFYYDDNFLPHIEASFFNLLNPLAISMGLLSASLFTVQGAMFLQNKTTDILKQRASIATLWFGLTFIILFSIVAFYIYRMNGYVIKNVLDYNLPITPLAKEVLLVKHGWIANYTKNNLLCLLPISSILFMLLTMFFSIKNMLKVGMICSSITIIATIFSIACALFPFILPSSTIYNHSLTIWDATSSYKTLNLMLFVIVIFLPIVLSYTIWAYVKLTGKVNENETLRTPESY